MRLLPTTSNRPNASLTHLDFLNQQCDALMQFKYQFHPGFKIFNESPVYYTYEELLDKGVLMLAKLPNNNEELADALIVVAPKLGYGEGVINSFHYNNVYIYYGDAKNLSKPPYAIVNNIVQIPTTALPGQSSTFTKGKLYIQKEGQLSKLILSYDTRDEPQGDLFFTYNNDKNTITNDSIVLRTYHPNRETVGFEDIVQKDAPEDGTLHELEASSYIISRYVNEKGLSYNENNPNQKTHHDIDQARDAGNYIIARLARGGGYYQFAYTAFEKEGGGSGIGAQFNYIPEATDSMGLNYVIDGDPRQKRFISTSSYSLFAPKVKSATALAFITSESNESIFQITTPHKGVWSGNNLINHEFYIRSETSCESFIVDDLRTKGVTNIDKTATPSYQVDFNNNYELTPLFILW